MTMLAPEMRPKATVLDRSSVLAEIAAIEAHSGSFDELEAKAERDLLSVAERAAYRRLGLLRFLAAAE